MTARWHVTGLGRWENGIWTILPGGTHRPKPVKLFPVKQTTLEPFTQAASERVLLFSTLMMANIFNLLRSRCLGSTNSLTPLISTSYRWVSSIQHTIQVKKDIEIQRDASRLGGGAKRIEGQHKKV